MKVKSKASNQIVTELNFRRRLGFKVCYTKWSRNLDQLITKINNERGGEP
jgi:hypothetical protein